MRRLVLTSLVLLALAACGKDQSRAFLDTRTPPSLGPRFWAPDGWAWGTIEVKGAPEIRYGVSGPLLRDPGPQKVMIIASGYGESAEVYFETARDLNTRGWSVWVIEPHGQGGSGRFPGAGDVGRSAGFDKDAAAIRWLVENVIRPKADDEVVLAATGSSATAALMLLSDRFPRVDRLVLWSPEASGEPKAEEARNWRRIGLGFVRGRGDGWKRPTGNITGRTTLAQAWQLANPDLRMGGPAWSWIAARQEANYDPWNYEGLDAVLGRPRISKVSQPVQISGPTEGGGRNLCSLIANCTFTAAPAAEHLGSDAVRAAWLDRLAPAPPPAPTDHGE